MTRKVIEDGNRRVILDRDEVIIEEKGEAVSVRRPDTESVEHRHFEEGEKRRHDSDEIVRRERPHENPGAAAIRVLATLLVVAGLAVTGLIVARFALLAFEAEGGNRAVEAVYDVTGPLVDPFEGIFSVQRLGSGGIIEPAAIIAASLALSAAIVVAVVSRAVLSRRAAGPDFRHSHGPEEE